MNTLLTATAGRQLTPASATLPSTSAPTPSEWTPRPRSNPALHILPSISRPAHAGRRLVWPGRRGLGVFEEVVQITIALSGLAAIALAVLGSGL